MVGTSRYLSKKIFRESQMKFKRFLMTQIFLKFKKKLWKEKKFLIFYNNFSV